MENNRKIAISGVIAIAIVAAIFAIALNVSAYDHGTTYNANSTFFVQEHSSGAYCQNNTYMQVRVNTSVVTLGIDMNITFDPNCVNITAADWTGGAWPGMPPAMPPIFEHNNDNIFLSSTNLAGTPAGDNLFTTITLHCQNATDDCSSYINFTTVVIGDSNGIAVDAAWQNGTINCTPVPAPDLDVSKVTLNPGNTRCDEIPRLYVNQSNNISAVVWNNGTANAGQFDVCFDVDGVMVGCVPVTGLAAGANTEVFFQCTPTCANYPVMPGFPPQSLPITINVSADCNCTSCPNCPPDGSCGKVNESDENNTLSMSIPAILPRTGTNGVIAGVVNNGYKSKNFDCNVTEEPLNHPYYELVGGGIEYNVSGEKISTFAAQAISTRIHEINLPNNATVKDARLYVYWYDKWGNYKTYPGGCMANLSVNFSGSDLMPEVVYQDSKAFGLYQSPKGSSVFNVTNVTSWVSGSGSYTAIVKNIEPTGGNSTTLLGQMLAVIYEGADHGEGIQLWTMEGTDYLMAADETHNSYNYSVSPDEATATVTFSDGSIELLKVDSANLITVVAQGMSAGSNLLFNGDVKLTDAWHTPSEAYPNSKINIENVSVKDNLTASNNSVGFQDTGTGGMQAHNAFLIVKKLQKPTIAVDPPLTIVQPQDQFDINITVNPNGAPVYAVEYYLTYDSTVAWAETQNKGPFLGEYWQTWVGQNEIDNPNGIIHYAETRIETEDGVLGPGTLATIQFTAIGERGDWSDLNLTGVIIVNNATKQPYEVIINNGRIEISTNTPPIAVATLKHRTNNCAKKYPSLTWLCACQSYDEDELKGYNITYIRWAFGDGQYGESGWDNCQKEHSYESWRWVPFGTPPEQGGKYDPFEVVLTVRDDGCPEEEGNDYMDVLIYLAGDANGDGRVNILDAVYVGKHWSERCDDLTSYPPEPCCWYWTDDRVQQDAADLNNDCVVNILDAVRIGAMWGHTAWES